MEDLNAQLIMHTHTSTRTLHHCEEKKQEQQVVEEIVEEEYVEDQHRWTFLKYIKSNGMSDFGIAGLMGCWQHESGNRPDRVEGDDMRSYPGYDAVL